MPQFSWMVGCLAAVVCMVSVSPVQAQDLPKVELVSINRGEAIATIRVYEGARLRDVNRLARHYAIVPGLHVSMDMIAARNPRGVIYVCFDNARGERPFMSRNPASVANCVDHRSTRWLRAGVTYIVPLAPEAVPSEIILTPVPAVAMTRVVSDSADRERIAELESQISALRVDLHEAQDAVSQANDAVADESDAMQFSFIALLCTGLFLYWLQKRWQKQVMKRVHRLNFTWSRYVGFLHRKQAEAESKFTQTQMLFGRQRKRIHLLLVQLVKHRKLLHQYQNIITNFQRRQSEDIARRERLPNLLALVDQAQIHQINVDNAQARLNMVLRWLKLLRDDATYPKAMRLITVRVYRHLLVDYRKDRLQHEARVRSCADAKTQAVEDLYALTGVHTDTVDPQSRLQRLIEAADKNAGIVQARAETLKELIQVQESFNGYFDAREAGIEVRENQIAKTEAELLARLQTHDDEMADEYAKLEKERRELVWTERVGDAPDVEYRMGELEGRTAGLERRAVAAERELEETNDFIKKAQREFRDAKELLEGIKKGPRFMEARLVQMAEYIRELEDKAGIQRGSMFSGLPAVGYGDKKPSS